MSFAPGYSRLQSVRVRVCAFKRSDLHWFTETRLQSNLTFDYVGLYEDI